MLPYNNGPYLMNANTAPPTLFIAAGGRHRSSHTAKLVDVAAAPSSLVLKPLSSQPLLKLFVGEAALSDGGYRCSFVVVGAQAFVFVTAQATVVAKARRIS
nr:hypothetical protein Iba_chr10fCG11380 [Ipomoea batatas]